MTRCYPDNTIYICESTHTAAKNPISNRYRVLIAAVVAERETGVIVDAEINSICEITSRFVRDLLVGFSLSSDMDAIAEAIESRYYGASKKSLIVCLRAVAKKFAEQSN